MGVGHGGILAAAAGSFLFELGLDLIAPWPEPIIKERPPLIIDKLFLLTQHCRGSIFLLNQ